MNGSRAHRDVVELIGAKRDRAELTDDEISWLLDAYTCGEVADEQMSALLMAIVLNGLSALELSAWTSAMIESGERLDLSSLSRPTVDKHSTGGVGDKVSLILAPLVAACGAAVPQLSGRGLGHTGGTLDKLESIPGWRASLSNREILQQLESVGCVICAAGQQLAPADRKLYALRDVTGTVESIPLIAASIMSKKIAEGTSGLVLDVKVGSGAFMKDRARARVLAEAMVRLGRDHGMRTVAVLSSMDVPLGLAGITGEDPAARLADGSAMRTYREMIAAQGGDPDAAMPRASIVRTLDAERDGIVHRLDALGVGLAAWRLGAGRARKEDAVSATAGVLARAKPGDVVAKGEPILELHTEDESSIPRSLAALDGAITISDEPYLAAPLVMDRVAD